MTSPSTPLLSTSLPPVRSPPPLLPLALTIRFSTSLPDIHIDLPNPPTTSVAALKQIIRSRLQPPESQHRLRLIYQGRILPDSTAVSSAIRAPPPPPRRDDDDSDSEQSAAGPAKGMSLGTTGRNSKDADSKGKGKGKGKQKVPAPARVYVNCSIGDSLAESELADEARIASQPPGTASSTGATQGSRARTQYGAGPAGEGPSSTSRAGGGSGSGRRDEPQGFNRLLTAGFTPAEVNALRLQFRSIRAQTYTRDAMPSPDTMRRLEDAWLDGNAFAVSAAAGVTSFGRRGSGGVAEGEEDPVDVEGPRTDSLIAATMIGFFWPLGAAGWLARDEGVVSRHWYLMILLGYVGSILLGVVREIGGS